MIISAITDDMVINCMNLQYLANKLNILSKNKPTDPVFIISDFSRFCEALTLKELLVYSCQELYQRYMGYVNQANLIKKKTISQIVKEFISNDLFAQRKTLIQLLMKDSDPEFQYMIYYLTKVMEHLIRSNKLFFLIVYRGQLKNSLETL